MKYLSILTSLLLLPMLMWGQATQTIRGQVIESFSQQPLPGVTIKLADSTLKLGANSNQNGFFEIQNVPVGRQQIRATLVGYNSYQSEYFVVNSAKEAVQNIEMTEYKEYTLDVDGEIVGPIGKLNPREPDNSFQLGSAISIKVEETNRFPISVNDPSRLVMVFPGVQASQDNNSDIIIRSNSPTGLLWRLEGIDIPNPNHFARKGSSGGGISVFSAQLLGNSDFSTGAFSANYGNALAGVFDMQFRPGNSRERSFRFKFGLLGTDLAAEGPIKRQSNSGDGGYSSYLVNYRYSTLGILNDLGFRLVGPRIDNNFQDLSFNLSFKSKDLNSTFTVFGIGGISEELWDPVKDSLTWSRPYRESRVYTSNMGAVGATFTHLIDEKSFLKAAVAVMGDRVTDNDDTLDIRSVMLSPAPDRLEEPTDWTALATARYETEEYQNFRISSHVFYQRQLGDQTVLKTGVIGTHMQFNFSHERRIRDSGAFERIVAGEGASQLLQAYAQIKAKPTTRLTLSGGIHSLFLALNNTYSVEPRLAMQYQLDETSALTLSYGLHGQVIPLGSYFTEVLDNNGNLTQPNLDLQPAKAHHLVMGWKKGFEDNLFITVEGYYQRLFDMPVSPTVGPHEYWFLNNRDGYAQYALTSTGTGQNYGVDLTIEKSIEEGLFFLISSSLYDSKFDYEPDPTRSELPPAASFNTRYNSRYQVSGMLGGEVPVGDPETATFQWGLRSVVNGGLRYTPGDSEASKDAGFYVPNQALTFSESIGTYFRIDARVAFRKNLEKTAYMISLDVQNATGRSNVRDQIFEPGSGELKNRFQAGLIPVFSFQLDF